MGLPTCYVGFSSTDIKYYHMMCAWKKNTNIDFNFRDCQLNDAINSENEDYIKRKCRERINMGSIFIQLIGEDTKFKYKYVRWEAEVAKEKGCTILGVNIDGTKSCTDKCPLVIKNIGAVFVPFSPAIIKYAIENYKMQNDDDNYHYIDDVYKQLGYN